MANASDRDPKRAKENWLEVALRWSEKDFDVWVDHAHIAGGSLPDDELRIGKPQPAQIGVRVQPDNLPTLEIDALGVWDKTDISLEEARTYTPASTGRQ